MFDEFERERCEEIATYMLEQRVTVRTAAAKFHISKSTVHKDITEKLRYVNPSLHHQVADLLAENKSVRHLRGGEATRVKYLKMHHAIAKDGAEGEKMNPRTQ